MLKYYTSLEDIPLYEDCSFSSKIIGKIAKGNIFEVLEQAGAWYEVQYNGNHAWLFIYNSSSSLIVEEADEDKSDIRIGDIITIDTKAAFTKDYYGKVLNTRKGYTPILYQVEDIVQDPKRVEFKTNGTLYSIPIENVTKFNANSIASAHAVASGNVQPRDTTQDVTDEAKKQQEDSKNDTKNMLEAFISNIRNSFKEYQQVNDNAVARDLDKLRVSSLRSVFGMPYQFLPIADMRLDSNSTTNYSSFGRKYAEKIVARMPLLVLIPGTAEFMSKYTNSERETVINSGLFDEVGSEGKKKLDDILSDSGQYYSFYQDWSTYYKYVNPLCHIASALMKVNDIKFPNGKGGETILSKYNWLNNADPTFNNIFGYNKGGCAYYINSDNQVNETFSNETTKTQLADKINSISDKVREMQFLMGNIAASSVGVNFIRSKSENELRSDKNTDKDRADKFTGGLLGNHANNNIFGSIMNGAGAILEGSKMRFPEIWADSSFSKDYSISIKLTSPDCDNLSLYLNIIVPLIHLICLAAPRGAGPNVYSSPFLVRCTYRGFFSIDMGIITSMSIRKGGEGKWSYAGIPTEVEVDITIKDLYDLMELSINNSTDFHNRLDVNVLSNTSLMDYLSNMCGVNINEPDIARTLILYKIIYTGKFQSLFPNIGESLNQWIYNKCINLFTHR